jgi:FkbM family methyltransferase
MLKLVKKIVPTALKELIKKHKKTERLHGMIAPVMPKCLCLDVGASYYPHINWWLFLRSSNTQWVAVEPNAGNLTYLDQWPYAAKVKAVRCGLSRYGGSKTLYVTNIDSGSSLLEPKLSEGMRHRIQGKAFDYFFPVREVQINTTTLENVMSEHPALCPTLIKLDTQGTELSILQGIEGRLQAGNVVGIEMESSLLADPIMKGSGKFWEASAFLEKYGFELIGIKPISSLSVYGVKRPKGNRYINECDAIFSLRRDVVATLSLDYRLSLFAFYITYKYYEEAISILDDDDKLKAHFEESNVCTRGIRSLLLNLA